MTFKHISVYVDNDEFCVARLRYTVALAEMFDACVLGVYVRKLLHESAYIGIDMAPYVPGYDEVSRKLENEAREVFAQEVPAERGELRVTAYPSGDAIGGYSTCTDLFVMPAPSRIALEDFTDACSPHHAIIGAAAPLMLAPASVHAAAQPGRVVVAWNGSREAGRALRQSMPLLQRAAEIVVLGIGNVAESSEPGPDPVAYLRQHDTDAVFVQLDKHGVSTGETLLGYAADNDVDLLVMGGYGHSRAFETILGGTTRHVLNNMTLPVFITH